MLKKPEYRRAIRTFVKTYSVCYHILRNTKEDMNMRTVFKMLLVIGALLIGVPLVAGFIVGLLEAAQEPITEFIVS